MADVDASRRFHTGLGLALRPEPSVDVWAQLSADAGALGIHDAAVSKGRPPGTVELGFATEERLEDVARRLADAGYELKLFDEDFGRSIRVVDPDGVNVRIQEIDQDTVRRTAAALSTERD
ncbi:VOC family protein [Embleya sp. NBC_00896]|uniref:VOC family protein n=1 Tax=Embleya sp. NBC_00896 TaxID=2975961 RepID=UPI0038640189|nr:VOC family protein [Embleya sp. NBC_00896]